MNAQRERAVLNEDIQDTQLRLIGADGSQVGIVSRVDALDEAQKAGPVSYTHLTLPTNREV